MPRVVAPPPPSGTFALHGRPVDVLRDGHVLFHFRARYYDPVLGRWLQRDPLPYNDGVNLYEAFGSNPAAMTDPMGTDILGYMITGRWDVNGWNYLWNKHGEEAIYTTIGFLEGVDEAWDNVETGTAEAVKEGALQVADGTVAIADVAWTRFGGRSLTGLSIDYRPRSQLGQSPGTYDTGMTVQLQLDLLSGTGKNVVTLGGYNIYEQLSNYLETGDDAALSQNLGAQGVLTLGTVGLSRAPLGRQVRSPNNLVIGKVSGLLPRAEPAGQGVLTVLLDTESVGATLRGGLPRPTGASWGAQQLIVIDEYAVLARNTTIPGQAHHLNQAAAYGEVIPVRQGMAIKLQGNIFTDVGAPHTLAHGYLESNFWNLYRDVGIAPTNLQYTQALQQSLRAAGLPEAQVQQAVRAAIRERVNFGVLGGRPVPNVPKAIPNLPRQP